VALPVLVRLVVAVLGIVVRRRGRCGVVRMMWCVWMPWRSVVLRWWVVLLVVLISSSRLLVMLMLTGEWWLVQW